MDPMAENVIARCLKSLVALSLENGGGLCDKEFKCARMNYSVKHEKRLPVMNRENTGKSCQSEM